MGDCALQRQRRREPVDVGGKALDRLRRLKAQVIVAVRHLSRAAWIDDVELRGDLIAKAEPRFAHERDDRVAVIGGEDRGVAQAQLLERVPHPVVGAGLGEMIASANVVQALFIDDRPEVRVGLVDRGQVGEGAANGDDAGTVGERLDPFRHPFLSGLGGGCSAARLEAVIDGHVRHDIAGERIVGAVGGTLDQPFELVEVARVRAEPNAVAAHPLDVVVLHGLFLRVSHKPHYTTAPTPGQGGGDNARQLRRRAARSSSRHHAQDRAGLSC